MAKLERNGAPVPLTFRETPIMGVVEVSRQPVEDVRGNFSRLFCREEFAVTGAFSDGPVQVNLAMTSTAGTVRGLHFQATPQLSPGESKLVTCIAGAAFDVAVDLRPDSPTRFRYHTLTLTSEGTRSLLVPPGVAHGMQALEEETTLLYLHGAPYSLALERGVRFDDPDLSIPWPLAVVNLSERDLNLPRVSELRAS